MNIFNKTQSQNEAVINELNEKMKTINDWIKEERARRIDIAQNSEDYDNNTCPICGKEISDRECCNGSPLVNACVCGDCDNRYVFPFRMRVYNLLDKEVEQESQRQYQICLNAELMIEFSNKMKSLIANNADVV